MKNRIGVTKEKETWNTSEKGNPWTTFSDTLKVPVKFDPFIIERRVIKAFGF